MSSYFHQTTKAGESDQQDIPEPCEDRHVSRTVEKEDNSGTQDHNLNLFSGDEQGLMFESVSVAYSLGAKDRTSS